MMHLRHYQAEAVAAIHEKLATGRATLLVVPTAGGKTVIFAHAIKEYLPHGRVMVIAHREELLEQAAKKIARITNEGVDVEQAHQYADSSAWSDWRAKVIVASIQTLNSPRGESGYRMQRFNPDEFSLIIIDEAHHSIATTYRRAIAHFQQNPNCKLLGVTATPDRHDEEALGQVFETVAYDYEIEDAINDGWIVPIVQNAIEVDSLDFSEIGTVAGDLNGEQLAAVMEREEILHRIAHPTFEYANGRKTLVFCASVAHAHMMAEIFNRHERGCAMALDGKTHKEERRQMLQAYTRGDFRFLCNVGVATEGYDEPSIEVVSIARPTKSRALYSQMVGRGFRVLPGVVDDVLDPDGQRQLGIENGHQTVAEVRRQRIADSRKPALHVMDFVGNSGRHKLVTAVDILGGKYSEDVIREAERIARETKGGPVAMTLEKAKRRIEERLRQQQEAERRRAVKATAQYAKRLVDPFGTPEIATIREPGWGKRMPATEKQVAFLKTLCRKLGYDDAGLAEISRGRASAMINAMKSKADALPPSKKQIGYAAYLSGRSYGELSRLTQHEISKVIAAAKAGK